MAPTMFKPFSIKLHDGRLLTARKPLVMGIVNVTPDSFYSASRAADDAALAGKVEAMMAEGVDIIDIGACSSRPGAEVVGVEMEMSRLRTALKTLRQVAPEMPVSVDTFRASVAQMAVTEFGVDIINDISGLTLDSSMLETVSALDVPYILMHMRGTPATMQTMTDYPQGRVAEEVVRELSAPLLQLRRHGVSDIIIDPGFGFSKTVEQNYRLMRDLRYISDVFGLPVLVGISRKSMLTKPLQIPTEEALNATTVLNTIALMQGASLIRVHDVAAARQAVEIYSMTNFQSESDQE